MGARPIALLNSLRFGSLDDPTAHATGASSRAWSPASPATATASASRPSAARSCSTTRYSGNPLVNVVLPRASPKADAHRSGPAPTASATRSTTSAPRPAATASTAPRWRRPSSTRSRRRSGPAVQVGDPFMEKLLLEACLELMQTDALVGMQDMGAAGSDVLDLARWASRGGTGIEIDVSRVPQRETGMTPYEIMLSESQERMLLVVQEGPRGRGRARSSRSGICTPSHIGDVTDDGIAARQEPRRGRRRDSEWPARRRGAGLRPSRGAAGRTSTTRKRLDAADADRPRRPPPREMRSRASRDRRRSRASAGSIASTTTWCAPTRSCLAGHGRRRRPRQGHDTRARRCRSTATAATVYLDPRRGAMLAVAEAARNVACAGARADRRHQLPQLRQSRAARDHVAARRGDRRHRPTRAGRSTSRSPAATSASTTRPTVRRSIRRRSSASSG